MTRKLSLHEVKYMTDTSEILNFMIECVKSAGDLVIHARGIIADNKTDGRNVVTEYDVRVQNMLRERLSAAVPDAGFFCEESCETDRLRGGRTFIIDPIDGTMNFVHGFNMSCISVAYSYMGEILAAAVFNPFSGELFTAEKGCGAFLNGRQIFCGRASLADSVVCAGTSPYRADLSGETFPMLRLLFENSLDIRRSGSAALDLCSVAAGRAGLYWELDTSFWDYAAGYLIVKEAGGECLTADGSALPFDERKSSITAGNPAATEDYFKLIHRG